VDGSRAEDAIVCGGFKPPRAFLLSPNALQSPADPVHRPGKINAALPASEKHKKKLRLQKVSGHDFSRAANGPKYAWASSPGQTFSANFSRCFEFFPAASARPSHSMLPAKKACRCRASLSRKSTNRCRLQGTYRAAAGNLGYFRIVDPTAIAQIGLLVIFTPRVNARLYRSAFAQAEQTN